VEGDYRNPPAKGTFEKLYEQSRRAMKREEVRLSREVRRMALDAFVEKLVEKEIEVIVACLDDHHVHLLARFSDHNPRHWVGMAKRNAAFAVRAVEEGAAGGIWSKKSKCEPVRDRAHQVNVVRYIVAHGRRGAEVWVSPALRGNKNAHG
jgi:REP element-mobilizing transposase RayT